MRPPYASRYPRRGQMEMIGLVFVVLLIVVGIVLYVSFSGRTDNGAQRAKQTQAYVSYLVAFGETDIPQCGVSVSRAARACAEEDSSLCDGDPCGALESAMAAITDQTLAVQGVRYNLSLEGKGVGVVDGCPSASLRSGVQFATLPVGTSALRLSVCTGR